MSEEIETDGKHKFLKNSKKTVVGLDTFYVHENLMRVIRYHQDQLTSNLAFKSIHSMNEWIAGETYKLEMVNQVIPNHNLTEKTILVVNSNLKSPGKNTVKFYEVVKLLNVNSVRLREVAQDQFQHGNYISAIPSIGVYVSEETIERKVISNSVEIAAGELAIRLKFDLVMIAEVLPLKIYQPTLFGISA